MTRETMIIIYLSIDQKKEIGSRFKCYPPIEVSTYFTRHTKEHPPTKYSFGRYKKFGAADK